MLVSPLKHQKQLVNDRFEVYFLGGEQGETVLEVHAHLVSEHAERAGSGTVAFRTPLSFMYCKGPNTGA